MSRRWQFPAVVQLILFLILACEIGAAAQRAVGGCCFPNGSCEILSSAECNEKGGTFLGLNTTCAECTPVCDDGNPCTEDSWNGRQCIYEPLDCDDGDACTADLCYLGVCGHEEIVCDDGNPCTIDSCVKGVCTYEPLNCDDGDACTTDRCDDGECVHEVLDCDDGNPLTEDTCTKGDCVNTVTEEASAAQLGSTEGTSTGCGSAQTNSVGTSAQSSQTDSGARPIIWYVVEAPWDETEEQLHKALCAGAARASTEFRVLMYRNDQTFAIERLLVKLPLLRRPDLILCSQETIDLIDPVVSGEALFFDISKLVETESLRQHGGLVGLPGPWVDWATSALDADTPLAGLDGVADGTWDPSAIADPISILADLIAARGNEAQVASEFSADDVIAEFILSAVPACDLTIRLSISALLEGKGLFDVTCSGAADDVSPYGVIVPGKERDQQASDGDEDNADLEQLAVRWFMQSMRINSEGDGTWARMMNASLPEEDERQLVEAFALWLSANGHGDAAERIAHGIPFPEESMEYLARYAWFRAAMRQSNPSSVPWWVLWTDEAWAGPLAGESQSSPPVLLALIGRMDGETGDLIIDFVEK